MTKTAHIAKALLKGEVLTIMDGFRRWGVTNLPREVSRQIEKKFDVHVSRVRVDFETDEGMPAYYFQYRLNNTESNQPGMEKMRQYISEYDPVFGQPKVPLHQSTMF